MGPFIEGQIKVRLQKPELLLFADPTVLQVSMLSFAGRRS